MLKILLNISLVFIFLGCVKQPNINYDIKNIEQMLLSINKNIDNKEARELSSKILKYSLTLNNKYNLESPPLYHNLLVNIGLKKRGLCWHFAYDMLVFILDQKYKNFDYYIVGANIDDYWEEHNAIVVTCKGCSYKDGIVFDSWRSSGKLYYSKVEDDMDFIWKQRGSKINSRLNIKY